MVEAADFNVDMRDLATQAAKQSLNAFTEFVRQDIDLSAHQKIVNEHLEALHRNDIENLAILEPPGHGKSTQASQIFPAWAMGKSGITFALACYGYDLALSHGRRCKQIIESPAYKFLFPWAKMSTDSASNSRFALKNGANFIGVGVGGSITGEHWNIGGIDDPIKNLQQAMNNDYQNSLRDWWKSTWSTRKLKRARSLLMQTLWSENDLGVFLPSHEKNWTILKMPAIKDDGTALWPEMFSIDELAKIKESIGSRTFEAMYQQNPTPLEGNMIKRDWIRVVPRSAVPPVGRLTLSLDSAVHSGIHNDNSSMQAWHQQGRDRHLVDRIKGKWEFSQLVFQWKNFCEKHKNAGIKLVEDTANGSALYSHCKDISGMKLVRPTKDKIVRLNQCLPLFEAGNVFVVDADFTEGFVEELVSFPNGRNDDDVDAATQFLNYSLENTGGRIIG